MGNGPMDSPRIDRDVGACRNDIHRFCKEVLYRVYAEDVVAWEEEKRARRRLPPLTMEQAEERTRYYLERIPYKLTKMRYSSFTRYFSYLKRLGLAGETEREEPSLIQESYPPAPTRRYYRLAEIGRKAIMDELSDPIMTFYDYHREKRGAKKGYYTRRRKK